MKYAAPLIATATLLSACGGGGGDETVVLPSGPSGYIALVEEALAIADAIETYDPVETLPTSTTADYTGVMLLGQDTEGEGTGYTGDVFLSADFSGGGSMTGTASGFYEGEFDSEGNPSSAGTLKAGTLNLNATSLSSGLFDLTVTGSLAVEGTSARTATGTMDAGFVGAGGTDPDAVAAFGTLSFSGASGDYEAFLLAN